MSEEDYEEEYEEDLPTPCYVKSYVFWDVEDCPIPEDVNLDSISCNINSALEKLGYYSDCLVEINAYCEKSIGSSDELYDAGIYDIPEGDRYIRVNLMLNLMLLTATFHSKNNPKLLMVISKNLPNDTEFARVVGALQSRGIKVLLVQPHDEAASQQLFRTPESISNLVRVKPVVNQTASFYQDFSVPTTYVDAPKTGVFWDAQDSPLPNHLDPESIFQSIKSALEGKGYFAYISIWVYADEKITFSNELLDEYRKSDIYFLPKVPGDKNLRYDRMLHDIFLWEIDTPGGYAGPSNVVVISNNIKIQGDNYLRRNGMPRIADFIFSLTCLNSRSYNSFLVQPELLTLTPEPSEWPGYLFDIGEVVGFFRVAPSQTKRMRKKSSKENFAVKTKSEEDFSSAYSHIYWDVDDYPIPKDIAPNCIYHNFKLALENMGYSGTLEVNAYSEKEIPLGLDEKSMDLLRIMFIPKRSPKIALWNIMYTVNFFSSAIQCDDNLKKTHY